MESVWIYVSKVIMLTAIEYANLATVNVRTVDVPVLNPLNVNPVRQTLILHTSLWTIVYLNVPMVIL
jgi:hypothetical protein